MTGPEQPAADQTSEAPADELDLLEVGDRLDFVADFANRALAGAWGQVIVVLDADGEIVTSEVVEGNDGPMLSDAALAKVREYMKASGREDLQPFAVRCADGVADVWTRVY
mgnify:CR=1 FL=1